MSIKRQTIKTGLTYLGANKQIEQARDEYVLARQKNLPANYRSTLHSHSWYQLMYASSGLLNVEFDRHFIVVPPHRAIWLPPNCMHQVSSPAGAKFRSVYFRPDQVMNIGENSKVLAVSPLIRELILTVVKRCDVDTEWQDHDVRLLAVLLDQLAQQPEDGLSLSIPKDARISELVTTLQTEPSNALNLQEWAEALGMSGRTLSRIFRTETGGGFKEWRQKVRLLYSLSLLERGLSVTRVAFDVGYSSPSAFTYAFHQFFQVTPKNYFISGVT